MKSLDRQSPLDGIRVVEVANWLAAPAAAALLADMGADVIKIEPPSGDPWRSYDLNALGYPGTFAMNYAFALDNRGKRGMTLNLDHPDGSLIAQRLAASADIFITNLIPRRVERYGLDYRSLAAGNPRLIYAHFSGYGAAGDEQNRLGFDYAAFWARSGIMSLVGEADGLPPMQRPGMGDHATSTLLMGAIMTALYVRERTGVGQELSASLLNSGLWVLGVDVSAALVSGGSPPKHDRTRPANPIFNTYRASDGRWLMLVMPTPDAYWPKVAAALGNAARITLTTDERFASFAGRREHSAEIVRLFDEIFAGGTREQWAGRLDAAGCIWAPVQQVGDAVLDAQARAIGAFIEVNHPTHGRYETLDTPVRFNGSRVGVRGPAPELGQHTEEVLLEQGYDWEAIAGLRESGALG